MIMDGLDTLSQVALAETLCFDNYHSHESGFLGSRLPSESVEELNTPVTSSSDIGFFVDTCTLDPLPITAAGRLRFYLFAFLDQLIEGFRTVYSLFRDLYCLTWLTIC